MTLGALTQVLRKRLTEFRHENRRSHTIFEAVNMIEIALNIAELGTIKERPVSDDEQIWFQPDWKIIHSLDKTDYDDLTDLFRELIFKVEERNWFKK